MHAQSSTVRIQDEIYRHMFWLEDGRSNAESGLAIALLRAWVATGSKPEGAEMRKWLSKISPICLQMIEAALKQNAQALPCAQ